MNKDIYLSACAADGYSIYIMGLPMTASEALLEDVFKKFGTIKKDGIQVKRNRVCSDLVI